MYERRNYVGNGTRREAFGRVDLFIDNGTIHAINNLNLSNIVYLKNEPEMIKTVQQPP